MPDFLLELLSEEIPARMQPAAAAQLGERFAALLAEAGLAADSMDTFATPRRLALVAQGLPEASEAQQEERRGPRTDAPESAIAGFVKATGLARDKLEERETDKGRFLFAVIDRPGRPAADLLAERLPALIRGFAWPKSMRWEEAGVRWVRPLRGIVALLGREVVSFEIAGIQSGRETFGHRFMGGGPISIDRPGSYADQLRAAFVVLDTQERAAIIRERAMDIARANGLALVEDEALVAENAGLTEWPVPLLGHFDPAFLSVPREIIALTMATNQKYFACSDGEGALAPAFVCVANLEAPDDGRAIVAGNERVLSARLSDARFFWEQDLKVPLEEQAAKLGGILFHEKLGTMADKVERVAKLARWLVETHPDQFPGATPERVERAARLAKADLVTGTVGEFPELQGIIGGRIAAAQGEPPEVVEAVRDHYNAIGNASEAAKGTVPMVVSLADSLDTLAGFFLLDQGPTGSRDPFGLRREAISVISMIVTSEIRIRMTTPLDIAVQLCLLSLSQWYINLRENKAKGAGLIVESHETITEDSTWTSPIDGRVYGKTVPRLLEFLADRLKIQQRKTGVRPDLIEAVFVLGREDDLVRLLARVRALQGFVETEDGANLLAGFKRAANILKIEEKIDGPHGGPVYASLLAEPAEQQLDTALEAAVVAVTAAVEAEDFAAAMQTLASLRPLVDRFFDDVTVNAEDPALRRNRLALLAKLRATADLVADFSKVEG